MTGGVTVRRPPIASASPEVEQLPTTTPDRGAGPGLALVGTYPPTLCGIASYTRRLRAALATHLPHGPEPVVVRLNDDGGPDDAVPGVVAHLRPDDPGSVRRAARVLSEHDVVLLQHEFGIFGPRSGIAALDLMEQIEAPVVVTLHTVAPHPTGRERYVLRRLVERADRVVVQSRVATRLLAEVHGVDPASLTVIQHGTDPVEPKPGATTTIDAGLEGSPILFNWGLIGPGKGLEWAIDALAILRADLPESALVIAGATHPKVLAHQGEAYRRSLERRIAERGLDGRVSMIDDYLPRDAIHDLLRRVSVVVVPYDNTEQTCSGVLVEAVAAGVPVVATAFPHAVEIAGAGGGIAVPHRDPEAIANAVRHLVTDPDARTRMRAHQQRLASAMHWDNVGAAYLEVTESLVAATR